MEQYVWLTLLLIYLTVGYALTAKWVMEEQHPWYPVQERSNTPGQLVAIVIWPIIVLCRSLR